MKHLKFNLTVLILITTVLVSAQNKISLTDAISIALEKNFDIQLVNNNMLIAENNKTIQNSGYLPTLTGKANANYSNNNAYVINQDDVEFNIDGVETTSYGASIGLNYNIYTGGSRKNQYEKLKVAYELSDVQRRLQIDNAILSVYTTYYNIAKRSIQLEILNAVFDVSKQRLMRTKYQLDFGQKTNLDVLNARVDVNNDSLNLLNAQIQLGNSKRQLNFLLGQNINQEFDVDETVEVNRLLNYETIQQNMASNNRQSKQNDLNKIMSEYDLKINQSSWIPNVSTNVSYGLNNSQNGPTSLFATQNTTGLNAGVNLNWNIFNGGSTNIKVQNSKINLQNQDIYKKQLDLNLSIELANTWANYSNQLVILNSEEINVDVNTQNFLKTQERYNLGQVTSIDFRQAQLNLLNSKVNLVNAMFAVKIAEIQLKKLEGNLIED